jgi:hypothetical protein
MSLDHVVNLPLHQLFSIEGKGRAMIHRGHEVEGLFVEMMGVKISYKRSSKVKGIIR